MKTEMFNSGNSSKTDGMVSKTAASVHAAVDKGVDAADNAVQHAKPAIDRVAGYAHQAVDRVAGSAEWVGAKGRDLKATQQQVLQASGDYLRQNPWKSLGIAVLAGFVLSYISSSNRSR